MHDLAPVSHGFRIFERPRMLTPKYKDTYQACRGWTIAVYEHVLNNDFAIRLLGTAVLSTYEMDGDLGEFVGARLLRLRPGEVNDKGQFFNKTFFCHVS